MKNIMYPDILNRNELVIHPGLEEYKRIRDIQAFYKTNTGEIYIGTHESTTVRILWHEIMHKILYEKIAGDDEYGGYKMTVQFDNIATPIEEFLFPDKITTEEYNYYYYYIKTSFPEFTDNYINLYSVFNNDEEIKTTIPDSEMRETGFSSSYIKKV